MSSSEKSASPSASKSTSTETKKATAASETKTTSTAAAPAASGKKMSVDASLKEMENKWEASVASHDFSAVQGMVANDFVGVSSKGKFTSKSSMLSEYKKDKDTYKSAVNEKLNIKSFGPNVAVVTGRAREKGTGKDGKAFDRTYLFTDTWVDRNGQWQCVASESMELRK
jgi:ketosteroid isomerase-like protein